MTADESHRSDPHAAVANLPLPPADMVARLRDDDFRIDTVHEAGGGVMGAKRLSLTFRADGLRVEAKWKAAPVGGDGWNNSPRRELAAYAAQALFLDPDDYPVPPIAARAIGFDDYRLLDVQPEPTLDGTRGVFGALAAWLENVFPPERAFDRQRFARDPAYAFHFANLNLLAYLIAHRDARSNNFLMSRDPANPRVFSIDNGIAFGGVLYNFFTWHFDEIRTAGLPRRSVERLRRVSRPQLDGLGILGQWQADADGVLRTVTPDGNWDAQIGNRVDTGRLQLGLTTAEIDAMADRLQTLLARIDAGELAQF
ncbi:MAG: hypothetical protein ABI629_17185 [bacterium]